MGKLRDFFSGKRKNEVKSIDTASEELQGLLRILKSNRGYISFDEGMSYRLSPLQAYGLFEQVSVVFDAVDKISSRVSSLSIVLKDRERNIVREHEIIKRLVKPGSSMTKTDFWKGLTESELLTSEAWVVARGRISRPPLELEYIEPYDIEGVGHSGDGSIPDTLKTNSSKDSRTYKKEMIATEEHWISSDGLSELIPIISRRYRTGWRGMSRLSALVEEVSHISEGNRHNRAMLRNGMNPSEVFSPDGHDIDIEDGEELKDYLARHHQGSGNSGKPLILPYPFKLISRARTNKDMDYMLLIDTDETRVYRTYNIPLPLIKSSTMTQSNYEVAIPFLYSDAVLPAFSYIAEQLTLKLGKRYNLKDSFLSYDEFNIPALNSHQVKLMMELQKTNAVSTNEVRQRGGYAPDKNGGEILVPANYVRLSSFKDIAGFDT